MSNPTTLVVPLADSLNGTDASGVASLTGVDPIRYSGGLYVEEATTNYFWNPRAAVDTSHVGNSSPSTLTRSTTYALVGGASFKLVKDSAGSHNLYHNVKITGFNAGDAVAFSFSSLSPDGLYARPFISYFTSGDSPISTDHGSYVALGTAFDDTIIMLATCPATTAKIIPGVNFYADGSGGGSANGTAAYTTCLQAEKKTYATSYADASLGTGYASVGTLWASGHTRAASSASISPAGILAPASGALAMRLTPTIETGVEEIWGECGTKGTGTDHIQWGRDATKHPFVEWSANDAAYQRLTATETVDADTEHFFYFGHDGTATSLQVDAGTLQTGTRAAVSASFGAGELTLQASAGGVIFHELAMFSEMLGPEQVAKLESTQNWSMNTLGGSTIIMPLTGGRRPRI